MKRKQANCLKDFRVMIEKMIQNLGNRIEKIQEMFNEELEELKNKQTVMNNIITEIKTTLEGINNRITETEERISELDNGVVEITAAQQNKEKRMKRREDSLETSGTTLSAPTIKLQASQGETHGGTY